MNPSLDESSLDESSLNELGLDESGRNGPDRPQRAQRTAAVLVTHNGQSFLPRTLNALSSLQLNPDVVVAVDTGSSDDTIALLQQCGVVDHIVPVAAGTGFAAAVHAGVDAVGACDWLWILHDDCAPEPDCLQILLEVTRDQDSVAVVGPKVLGWDEPRTLLEVGLSISRSGRRHTGLERREQDQGQYDAQRDVLAVGSPGMLVRGSTWAQLKGYDRSLPMFREDVDLGWRANLAGHRVVIAPAAVVHHAEATARGRRTIGTAGVHRGDRASALYVLLANSSLAMLLPRWLLLLLVSGIRAVVFVLGKAPQEATGELAAIGQTLLRPILILRGRHWRRGQKKVSGRLLRPLFPSAAQQLRQTVETLAVAVAAKLASRSSGVAVSVPSDDDLDNFVEIRHGRFGSLLRRPGTVLFLVLAIVSLASWRGLYQSGVLHGGSLLPVPDGAREVWSTYLATWHPVSAGSSTAAHPSLAVFAALATLLLGKATWVVPLLFVLAPPVAGWLAYRCLRSLALSASLRLWAAVAYGLNPALLAGIAQGRWTTAVVAVVLPLLAAAVARTCGVGNRLASGRAAAAAALLMAIVVAVAPSMWPPLAVLVLLAAWRLAVGTLARIRTAFVVVSPVLLMLPWLPELMDDPSLMVLEPGTQLLHDVSPPWQVLLLNPGGPADVPLLLGAGLMVIAVAAVLRAHQARPVRAALAVAAVALLWSLVLDVLTVTPHYSAVSVVPWAGPPLVMATAGVIVAAAVAARGSRHRLRRRALSWRQPVLFLVTAVAIATPVAAGSWWVMRGAAGPLDRGLANPLPAFVRAQSELPEQIRTLVVEQRDGELGYTLLRKRDARLGDSELAPPADRLTSLDAVVADLASGRGSAPVEELAQYAVQFILAVAPVDPTLEVALDSAPGLLRVANPGESSLWRIDAPTGRVRVVADDDSVAVLDPKSSEVDSADSKTVVDVPAGSSARTLQLAELSDPGWTASAPTGFLERAAGNANVTRFDLGRSAAEVTIDHRGSHRVVLLWVQAGLLAAVVIMALPGRRRDQQVAV